MSDSDERKVFANNLNYYMKACGKNQADLITDLGINKSTISTWCKAKKMPRMGTIQTLADYFGINKSDLIEEPFSNRLKKALSLRQMKQRDLANATGISESAISQYLSGYARPKDDRVHALAMALDVSEGWLLGFDANMERVDLAQLHAPTRIVLPGDDDVLDISKLTDEQKDMVKKMVEMLKNSKD